MIRIAGFSSGLPAGGAGIIRSVCPMGVQSGAPGRRGSCKGRNLHLPAVSMAVLLLCVRAPAAPVMPPQDATKPPAAAVEPPPPAAQDFFQQANEAARLNKWVATVSDFPDRGLLSWPAEEPTVTKLVTVATSFAPRRSRQGFSGSHIPFRLGVTLEPVKPSVR